MPAFRIASASRRMPVFALALVALSIGAALPSPPTPPACQGRELGPRRAAFLPAAAGRDRASQRPGRHLPTSSCSMPPRRGRDEQLFRRATEMALQARAGDQALSAVLATGARRCPESADALRYQIQLLVALNRIADVEKSALSALLRRDAAAGAARPDRGAARLLGRAADRNAARRGRRADLAAAMPTQPTLGAGVGRHRTRLARRRRYGQGARLRRSVRAKPIRAPKARRCSPSTCCQGTPEAEAIVKRQLAARADSPTVRLLYVRTLAASQRLAEAAAEIEVLTRSDPNLAPPWLTLGALELEDEATARSVQPRCATTFAWSRAVRP